LLAKPMRNKVLHRRLAAVEAASDEVAKAIELERIPVAKRRISIEEAERVYKQFKEACSKRPRSEDSSELTLDQIVGRYFREVQKTTLPHRNRLQRYVP
jgi:hypothetical protein